MQVTTFETRNYTRANMGEWLYDAWRDGRIEPDDSFMGDGESFARFGRRTIHEYEGAPITYTRHDTYGDAWRQMDTYHTDRAPVFDWDLIISAGSGWRTYDYAVSAEGCAVGTYRTRDAAMLSAARWMVDNGVFCDAFLINERGNSERVDEEIRDYHDAGGDKMLARWENVTPEDVDEREMA